MRLTWVRKNRREVDLPKLLVVVGGQKVGEEQGSVFLVRQDVFDGLEVTETCLKLTIRLHKTLTHSLLDGSTPNRPFSPFLCWLQATFGPEMPPTR